MIGLRMTRRSFVALIASILTFGHVPAMVAHGGQAEVGQLRIEGQGIEQLVLRDEKGSDRTFDQPGSTLSLPPGEYQVHSISLQGGHFALSHLIPGGLRTVVVPEAPATLKIGAPLRQVVRVERQGPVMVLHYELIGQGGESYAINRSQVPQRPAFTIYRGDHKVALGRFRVRLRRRLLVLVASTFESVRPTENRSVLRLGLPGAERSGAGPLHVALALHRDRDGFVDRADRDDDPAEGQSHAEDPAHPCASRDRVSGLVPGSQRRWAGISGQRRCLAS